MANTIVQPPSANYDARWFIWTIVFLVVTGISLVSYISLSDPGYADASTTPPIVHAVHRAAAVKK